MTDDDPRTVFRLLPHTADLRLEIRGPDLQGLVRNAVAAFNCLLELPPDSGPRRSSSLEELVVSGSDPEDALVRLLGELLYRAETEHTRFDLDTLCLVRTGEQALEIRLSGDWRPFPPESRQGQLEIKAVTYHGARIRQDGDGMVAEVILDV